MSNLRNRVLLYRPSISIWTARKKDKEQSAKVTEDNGAVTGAAVVHKALMPDNPTLKAIMTWASSFREFIYLRTAPWEDKGWRAGPIAKHMDLMAAAGDKMREGDELFDQFCSEYAAARESARFQLNHLFNETDYPGINEVRSKFSVSLDVQPLPSADDFRIYDGLPPDEVEKLVQLARNSERERFQAATQDATERLLEVVEHMATSLQAYGSKGKGAKFYESTLTNITEIVEAMPSLNITGDARLDALAAQARELTTYSLVDLKQNKDVRDAAIKEAAMLVKEIKGEATPAAAPVAPVANVKSVFADMLEI